MRHLKFEQINIRFKITRKLIFICKLKHTYIIFYIAVISENSYKILATKNHNALL